MSWLQWQLARESARSYEHVMVTSVLLPAAEVLIDRLPPATGNAVLDAGCGTGTVSRLVVPLVGPSGKVVGVDVNEAMLEVAHQVCPKAHLETGDVRELQVPSSAFDVVYAAHTIQFVAERSLAAREIARVTKPGGRVGVTTWCSLDRNHYFGAVHDALLDILGADVAGPLAVACSLGSATELESLLEKAGLVDIAVEEVSMDRPLGELERFVPSHLASTPMSGVVRGAGGEAMNTMVGLVVAKLDPGHSRDVVVPFRQLVATASRPAS